MGKSASLKEIESYLHPCPKINGLDILHRHQGQYIYFEAWDGNDRKNRSELRYHRDMVLLSGSDFYKHEADNLEWISQQED